MCEILNYTFLINDTRPDGPDCNASADNEFAVEVIVNFNIIDVGKRVDIGAEILRPDGNRTTRYYYNYLIPGIGTQTFIIPVNDVVRVIEGIFSLDYISVWAIEGIFLCESWISSAGCTELSISSSPPSCPAPYCTALAEQP